MGELEYLFLAFTAKSADVSYILQRAKMEKNKRELNTNSNEWKNKQKSLDLNKSWLIIAGLGFYTCVMFLVLATELGGLCPLLTEISEPCKLLFAKPKVPEELLSLVPLFLGTIALMTLLLFLNSSLSVASMS